MNTKRSTGGRKVKQEIMSVSVLSNLTNQDVEWAPDLKFVSLTCLFGHQSLTNTDLNIIYTHPDYRRRGVADVMLNWGKQKADEMGVEMWLDATEQGVPVYLKHGFTVVHVNHIRAKKQNPGELWKKTEHELGDMTFWTMWRPVGRDYEEGMTKPWEER